MTHPPLHRFLPILGMARDQHIPLQGLKEVTGEVIENKEGGIWDLEADEAEVGASRGVLVI